MAGRIWLYLRRRASVVVGVQRELLPGCPIGMAAAARVLTAAGALQGSHAGKCGLLFQRRPFAARPGAVHLRSKALHKACRALYQPDIQVKEEGQPETLDYRVFFLDGSGKKVRFLRSRRPSPLPLSLSL